MGFLDRLLRSPADRRLAEAEAAAEAWASAPKPSTIAVRPKAGAMGPANTPKIDWSRDQSPSSPTHYTFRPGYSDHVYQQFSAPLAFDGFGLDRVRNACSLHRLGNFYESSALMVAILGFAPVLAALQQRVAPILALSRHVHGGDKGLAKLVAGEVREALVPEAGLEPSPFLPPELWGTIGAQLALMNFAVLQHIDGDPDPVTGVRPRYTRTWPPWALQWYRSPRKLLALTSEATVEVCNDGKFTLVADEEEPYLASPLLALGDEALAGKLTQEQRLSWQAFFGNPKLWATPPEKLATHGEGGDAFYSAVVDGIYGPEGRGVLPYGSRLEAVSISGEGSGAFKDALLDRDRKSVV